MVSFGLVTPASVISFPEPDAVAHIPQMIHDNRYSFQDDDSIGIVYPVYNGELPYIVKDFIEKCKIEAPYVFVIATYGNAAVGTLHEMEKALSVKGNHAFMYL
jgi:hypothetical protein